MTEEERDAHLREALRHAPDAQVQPPAALSAFILSEARAKARDAAAPARPVRHPLATLWDWLARPSVAAGFAGLMAATLVGLMWWDQPMDEALPRRPVPAAEAPAPTAATPAPAQAPMAPPVPASIVQAPRPAPEPTKPVPRKALPAADKKAEGDAPAAAVAAATERATPTPAPAPAAPAIAPESAAPAVAGALAKSKSSDESRRLRSMAAADALSSNQAAAKSELKESRARQEVEAHSSIASLRASIAAEPSRWAWQRGNGPAQDMTDAVYAWLAQLEGATGSTWQTPPPGDAASPLAPALRLLRDGRVTHSLQLTARGVLWESGASARLAELPAGPLNALRSALDSSAP